MVFRNLLAFDGMASGYYLTTIHKNVNNISIKVKIEKNETVFLFNPKVFAFAASVIFLNVF